jgi:ComEC/Rec2-related protein
MKLNLAVLRNPLMPVLIVAGAGIIAADYGWWVAAAIAMLPLSFLAMTVAGTKPRRVIIAGALVAFLVFGWVHRLHLEKVNTFPLASEIAKGSRVEIEGNGWIASRARTGERSSSATLEIVSLRIGGKEIFCDHRVPVWIQKPGKVIPYGSVIDFSGLLLPLESADAPGGFDPAAFHYRKSGSLARLEIRSGDEFEILEEKRGSRLISIAQRLRDHFESGLLFDVHPANESYARLIAAMSLGARENSPEDLEEAFRLSGTMHLFAVSGLHVGVVGGALLSLFWFLRVPKRYAVLIVIPLVLFYAVLTGLRPSAVRAAIMMSIFLAGYAFRENPRLLNTLALAGILILGFQTSQLFLPGFQLSFAVLLFIALFAEKMRDGLARLWVSDPFIPPTLLSPLRRGSDVAIYWVTGAIAVSIVSWLGSLGLLTWHFQSIAPIGIIANLPLVAIAGGAVILAMITLFCFSLKLLPLVSLLNKANVGMAIALTTTAEFFAALPGAHLHSGEIGRENSSQAAVILDIMGDRGDGATLLTNPDSRSGDPAYWMLDTGSERTWKRHVLPTLRTRAINRLDGVVLSHGDVGHIGGAPDTISQMRPGAIFEPRSIIRSSVYSEIRALADSRNIPLVALRAGQRITLSRSKLDENLVLQVLAPAKGNDERLADDRSLVLRTKIGEFTLLHTFDSGFHTERDLLRSGADLSADIWIRGQHVESPSGSPEFLDAINPKIVISSHSKFPASQRVLDAFRDLLKERKTRLITTDETGVVTMTFFHDRVDLYSHRLKRYLQPLLIR